jgi:hypothetical protein
MGFQIVQNIPESFTRWLPIDRTVGATTLYVDQLVKMDSGSFNGLAPLAVASGAVDTSNKQVIYGVVIGNNDFKQTFLATYGQYIASVQSVAAQLARNWLGAEGMWAKNDPSPMVKVALIGPHTVLSAPLCNGTLGTAPTLLTATAVNATMGLGMTTNATDVATVANMCTTYCRSGLNKGLYRVNKSASATVHTFDTYWPYTLAIGDTFVTVPVRLGEAFVQINSTAGYLGMCLDVSQTPATNYFQIDVLDLDLKIAGKEKVIFKFNASHFNAR